MGLQWFAGFEAGDRNELVSYSGGVSVQSGYARSGEYGCRIMVPPSSAGFVTVANGFDSTGRPANIARTTFTIGFGLRLLSLPEASKAWEGLLYIASGTTHRASLRIGQDATLRLHIGALGSAAGKIARTRVALAEARRKLILFNSEAGGKFLKFLNDHGIVDASDVTSISIRFIEKVPK